VPEGYRVLPIVQAAIFDPRRVDRPHAFNPYRRDEEFLTFGMGQHWCIGAYIAKAQLTQTFKPLLKLDGLRPVQRRPRAKRYDGLFPTSLEVRFDKP
jgi:cytochrome P450